VDTGEIRYRVADFLKAFPPFQAADLGDLLAMAERGRVRFHERGEYLLWQGEPHRLQLFVIQQGTVSLWDDAPDGPQLRDVRGAGDMLGLERYVGARSCAHTARSETDVVLYAFPADDFEACVLKYPQAEQFVSAEDRSAVDYHAGAKRQGVQHRFLHDSATRRPPVTCRLSDRLSDVAALLLAAPAEAVAVIDEEDRIVGVATPSLVLAWAAAGGAGTDLPLSDLPIPLTPPPTMPPDAPLSEGVLGMAAAGQQAVAVTLDGTRDSRVQALVTARDLGPVFGDHPGGLLSDISRANTAAELAALNRRARAFFLAQLDEPSAVEWLTRLAHLVDRAVFARVVAIARAEADGGCWCFAGSSGRAESLTRLAPLPVLVLDRDERLHEARQAFRRVLEVLLAADYLPRDAFEPDFCVASMSDWKLRYREWVDDPVRREAYRVRTLFDLRPVLGPRTLWEDLERDVAGAVNLDFVRVLANDCLANLPPLTFFEDAVIDHAGEHVATFQLERTALRPLVDVGRTFGLATGRFLARSTLERYADARARLPEHQAIFREASDAVRIVLWEQARVGITLGTPGADLPPALLSSHDRRILKGGFRSILRLLEFTYDSAWLDRL
jgi:CBS domain-containing protein